MQFQNYHHNRLTLSEVADTVGVHVKTVQRWVLRGVRGKTLRSTLVGGRRFVFRQDLADFLGDSMRQSTRTPESQNTVNAVDADMSSRKRRGAR